MIIMATICYKDTNAMTTAATVRSKRRKYQWQRLTCPPRQRLPPQQGDRPAEERRPLRQVHARVPARRRQPQPIVRAPAALALALVRRSGKPKISLGMRVCTDVRTDGRRSERSRRGGASARRQGLHSLPARPWPK